MKEGDLFSILDGKGHQYEAKLTSTKGKKCTFSIHTSFEQASTRNYRLHIAVAPTKNMDRMEWFVEKAIEVGVDEISFLLCEHSERKNINLERIEKIAISALKQSMNLYLPTLNELVPFTKFIANQGTENRYIAHLEDEQRKLFKHEIADKKEILLLIGPEGDFSKAEIDLAIQQHYVPVSLGESRLRTETAALAGCFICQTILY
jgi:16S rRNA (uracil1498-N3)-methyltransferase